MVYYLSQFTLESEFLIRFLSIQIIFLLKLHRWIVDRAHFALYKLFSFPKSDGTCLNYWREWCVYGVFLCKIWSAKY